MSPRIVLHVNHEFAGPESYDFLEVASRVAADRGGLTVAFDRDIESAFAERYGMDDRRSLAGTESPGTESHGWRSSQLQVVTLNLPRVGYLAGDNQVKVFEELTRLMEIAAQAHLEKRVFLEKLLALGEKGPLSALTTQAGGSPFLRLNWTTHAIGILGLNELCRAVLETELHESPVAMEFARKVLLHLKHEAERLSSKHRVRFVLNGQPTEASAQRLARLDLRFFGQTAEKVVGGRADLDSAYYTDGVRISAKSEAPVLDHLKAEGVFHELRMANAATELWLGQLSLNVEELSRLISEALFRSSCAGIVFCPAFTLCSDCGRQSRGLSESCPDCGSSRVDAMAYSGGRYGYTASWDGARLAELADRAKPLGLGL